MNKITFFILYIFLIWRSAIITSSDVVKEKKRNLVGQSSRPYWKEGIVYHVFPKSILDTDGDGIGDIPGITAKADYFAELGVKMIMLTPILQSPMKDFGYDITSYTATDPIMGTMEDFENLIKEFHSKGLKIVFDFVINHTSEEHEWFQKCLQNDTKYRDYYVWTDPLGFNETGDPIPPNNWLSVFRFSAWEWSKEMNQFYFHTFLREQPDLNYRNPDVVEEMTNVLRFWLDKGVDGFRMDATQHLIESDNVFGADEPVDIEAGISDPTNYYYLNHTYTSNQPETYDVIRRWRQILDTYEDRFMMIEVYDKDISNVMRYYGNETDPIAHFPFNYYMISNLKNRSQVTGINLKGNVDLWMNNIPTGAWPNYLVGNQDRRRVATRMGVDLIDAINIFILLLPGTPVTYYGEEIGMENEFLSYENTQDQYGCNNGPEHYTETSRDPERTPMQWDDTKFAGFTKGSKTWIPVNKNYLHLNVKVQNASTESHLQVYKRLAQLRKENTFQMGTIQFPLATNDVVAFVRSYQSDPRYLIVINTSAHNVIVDVTNGSVQLPDSATVVIRSSTDSRTETETGSVLSLASLSLIGGEGLVLLLQE